MVCPFFSTVSGGNPRGRAVSNPSEKIGIVVLAAGKGTRMNSDRAKVLHEVCGTPMIVHVAQTAAKVAAGRIVIVVGHQADAVRAAVDDASAADYAVQEEQLGTGHAVQCALPSLAGDVRHVVILCGDVPLLRPATIESLVADHFAFNRDITVLAVEMEDPTGYGRVVFDERGRFTAIVEQADADDAQLAIQTINTGIYCVERRGLGRILEKVSPDNAQGEYYLTDIVRIGVDQGMAVGALVGGDPDEVVGVNTPEDLETATKILESGRLKQA
jgi:UDP-N-acetylglucosamine diphosphorylase/glucosamine-1-phosphate N-acetyltransferase